MAFAATELCRPLRLAPTQKAVLMCLADYCHADGKDWHSIAAIQEWTCLGKTAVIDALKGLETLGFIVIERRNGARSTTYLQLERLRAATESGANQTATQTGARDEPVRVADATGAPGVPQPVRVAEKPVRVADPKSKKNQETSEKNQKAPGKPAAVSSTKPAATGTRIQPDDVSQQVWRDWLALRKAKKAPVTETVLHSARAEAEKAGMTLEAFLQVWCARGSQGLQADWLRPAGRQQRGDRTAPAEPQWRTEQRARNVAFLGPAASPEARAAVAATRAGTVDIDRPHGRHAPTRIGFEAKDYNEGADDIPT